MTRVIILAADFQRTHVRLGPSRQRRAAPKDMTRFGLTLYCSDCALATVHGAGHEVCADRPNRKQTSEVTPDTTP